MYSHDIIQVMWPYFKFLKVQVDFHQPTFRFSEIFSQYYKNKEHIKCNDGHCGIEKVSSVKLTFGY